MTTSTSLDLSAARAPLQRRVLLAYGVGDAGTGMASALVGFYLFVFYTAVANLPAWLAGTVLMLVRIWDVFSDQLIGWLGDRTCHQLGPRVPWMLWGALPLGVSMALMWWVPPFMGPGRLLWFVAIAALFQMSYSIVNLPYSALPTELTGSIKLRTRLVSARFSGSVLASLVGLLLGASLTSQGANGYWQLGLIAGLIVTLGSLTSAIGLAPAAAQCRRPSPQQNPFLPQLRSLGRNPFFLRVVLLYLLLWGALQLMQPVAILYLSDALHLPGGWIKGLLIPFQISALLGIWIWNRVAARRSRLRALQIGGLSWILLCLVAILLPVMPNSGDALADANRGPLLLVLGSLMALGISAATAYLLPWAFLPDAIDAEANHPAGLMTAFLVQIQKLGSALSVFVLGWLLSWSGYQASLGLAQPAEALLMIRLCMGLLPALLVLAGLWVMRDWERIAMNRSQPLN
jgi:GPH family glycoside/pentoside/hexuronide:cation symporter